MVRLISKSLPFTTIYQVSYRGVLHTRRLVLSLYSRIYIANLVHSIDEAAFDEIVGIVATLRNLETACIIKSYPLAWIYYKLSKTHEARPLM